MKSIQELTKKEDNKIGLFVGSGISVSSPTNLPLGSEVISSLLNLDWVDGEEKFPVPQSLIDESNLKYIRFEHLLSLFEEWGNHELESLLFQFAEAKPNWYHFKIAELCQKKVVQNIITTNFDSCIEKAFIKKRIPYNVIFEGNDSLKNDVVNIFKIHGSIKKQGDKYEIPGLKATLETVSESLPIWKKEILNRIFATHTVVFMGYSGWDSFDINPELYKLNNSSILWVSHKMEFQQQKDVYISPEVHLILKNSKYPNPIIIDTTAFLNDNPQNLPREKFKFKPTYDLKKNYFHPSAFIGRVVEAIGDYNSALNYYNDVYTNSTYSNYLMVEMLDIGRSISVCHYELGNYKRADLQLSEIEFNLLGYIQRVMQEGKTPVEFTRKIFLDQGILLYEEKALVASKLGNHNKAQQLINRSLEILEYYESNELVKASIKSRILLNKEFINLNSIINSSNPTSQISSSIIELKKSQKLKLKVGDIWGLILNYALLGDYYLLLGDFNNAIVNYFQFFQGYQKLKTPPSESHFQRGRQFIGYNIFNKKSTNKKIELQIYVSIINSIKEEYEISIAQLLISNVYGNWEEAVQEIVQNENIDSKFNEFAKSITEI